MMFEKEKIQEAYINSIINEYNDKELDEASQIKFDELDDKAKKFIASLLGKQYVNHQSYFDGIHGKIVQLHSNIGDKMRINKSDLKKLLNNKEVRWLDVSTIGF